MIAVINIEKWLAILAHHMRLQILQKLLTAQRSKTIPWTHSSTDSMDRFHPMETNRTNSDAEESASLCSGWWSNYQLSPGTNCAIPCCHVFLCASPLHRLLHVVLSISLCLWVYGKWNAKTNAPAHWNVRIVRETIAANSKISKFCKTKHRLCAVLSPCGWCSQPLHPLQHSRSSPASNLVW